MLTNPKGKILGATIVANGAGELIAPWILAMQQNLKMSAVASMISPYPTRIDLTKRVAGEYYAPALYGAKTKALVKFLMKF